MNPNRPARPAGRTVRIRRTRQWIARRRTALASSALRGAAYATGAGVVGLGFYLIQQRL
ncbi:hypothetical protein [Streptomyces sp. NPDC058861]|uniref:hypothetical protein n=1 Tax=Streptomyces sp. NPDC058861 TaxID=3346653 RepID=UPI00367A512B